MEMRKPADFRCEVKTSFDDLDSLRQAWDTAACELGGSVYMSYDWVRTWWEFYGGGKQLRVFIFYAGEKIVGLVPIYIDRLGFGPLRFQVARLVGSNIPPKVFNPPVDEAWAQQGFRALLSQLFEQDGCDLLSFGPVSELQKSASILKAVCQEQEDKVRILKSEEGVHSVFWLPATMEEYYESLSKNERKNRRKYELRLLKKEYDTRVEVLKDPAETSEEFERFAVQHAGQWAAEGKTGHFGAWPRALEFNRALVKAQAKQGRLRFIRILANGTVIANQYTFAFGKAYYWELPSRAIEPQWERFSLGPTGIVTMMGAGTEEGITRLEGGLAHYDYKIRLGAKEYTVQTTRALANRRSSRLRLLWYNMLKLAMLYGYHKLWYRRITPRLPAVFRTAQWNSWLRLDF